MRIRPVYANFKGDALWRQPSPFGIFGLILDYHAIFIESVKMSIHFLPGQKYQPTYKIHFSKYTEVYKTCCFFSSTAQF